MIDRPIRLYCGDDCIALTNGFRKKSQKTPKGKIERASRIKTEYDQIRKGFSHD
ncbi:MAG: hypothetical protein HKP58_08315 [Desulfatitalea sp.]|nr:type II toxin-antitoxin system RelE/ParE family toxin [Desulfatitalea sp.]NNK00404.1 hypothetical protein [Desulfatitalea sp.]